MDEERRKKELERLKATLDALDKFKKKECSFDDASTSLKCYMNIGQCECVYFLDKFEEEKASTKIHSELRINQSLLETNQLDPSMIIAESTALCGTYFKRDHYDLKKPILPLVNVRQDVEFKTPNIAETNVKVEFDDENSTSENENQNKFTIISNFTVPVSLWEPNLKQLTLTENVIEKLKCIQNCLGTNEAKTLAINFLREFGSHLYLGNIHFGGIFKVETTFKGCNIHEKAMIRDSIRYRHLISLGSNELYIAESGANSSEVESHDFPLLKEGKFIGEDKNNVMTTLSVLGGPQNVSSLLLWKKGLVYNNRTWAVVHAGEPKEHKGKLVLEHYIGIWDIVKKDKIETAFGVAELLKQTWEESSGFKPDDVLCETFQNVSCKWELQSRIDNVTKRLSSNVEAQICVDSLQNLYEKVVETTTVEGCQKLWKQELTSNVFIADVLTKVTTISFSEEQRSEVKALVKKLLKLADNVEFLRKHIMQLWLKYNISVNQESSLLKTKQHSLADLQSSLKAYLENINIKYKSAEGDKKGGITLPQNVTLEVGIAVCELLNEFKGKADSIRYIFLLSIVLQLGYDVNKENFQSQITVTTMDTFLEKLDNATTKLNQYGELPDIVKQASAYYHLKESMTHSGIYPKPIAQQKFFKILKHIKSLGFNFDATVMSAMDGATVNLENHLKSLESKVSDSSNKAIISWEYFEKLPDIDCCNTIDQPESESVLNIKEELMNILERLSLSDYFPGKLSLQSVLSINDIKFAGARLMSDIPWAILHEIIAVNFNFREKVLNDFVKNISPNEEDEDDDDLLSGQIDKNVNNTDTLDFHPSDVFMAIFQCCDPFLKRVVAQKISLCQLALPYVFEDYSSGDYVLSLWPLRDIYIDSISESVATQVLKTVSFLRIGEGLTKSKSRIINEFLRDINEEHSTFFHRDCKLGMNTRIITNGMIEASWYVPAQTTNTPAGSEGAKHLQSEERLTVLNLRGDAFLFPGQLKTLLKLTNVVVVLISAEDIQKAIYSETLKTIHSSKCAVILLTNFSMTKREIEFLQTYKREKAIESGKTKVVTTFLKKQKRHMNQDELQNLVRKNVFGMLKDIDQGIKIEEMVTKLEINSDENSKNYRMKAKAADIHRKIKKYSEASNRKQIILPLQGEKLWQEWSKKQKEQKRPRSQEAKYNPEETLLKDMQELRRQQVEACNESPDVMAEFIHVLVEIIHDNEAINFFLFWMRQFLDDESRIEIPKLQDEFFEAFEKYESTERKSRENKQRIDDIEKKLAHASFGLEHFFREIGQIYEAFLYSKEDNNCTIAVESQQIISLLPMVAAKLLMLGQPLELMDGDAANVPLKWIKAVFREIKVILGEVRLLSISVLGIQSSGKSTLLNTMFGLRFPVSAGRCTRGIFAQLLPVDKSNSSLEFEYALVIDTEGLRAPELAGEKVKHDNELATLVIGAADVVLINIKGETIADMQDVLQIVIHGLMRIKQVNKDLHLRQSSMFVHQNVSAENAKKQMIQGNKKIVENLDRMTNEVASQEQFENISSFKDVIRFDPTKDVRFVPDLWHGARKMAPASPEYSFTVKVVAQDLLNIASSKKQSFLSIENTVLYFESLWNGILAEDFVFSFRNCLEVKAYSLLELEYQKFNFSLNMLKHDWIYDNVKPKLSFCKEIEEIESVSITLYDKFQQKLKVKKDEAEKNLNTFIDQSEFNEYMILWKENKKNCLRSKADSLKHEMEVYIRTEKEKSSIAISHGNLLVTKEAQINEKAKDVASSLIGKDLTHSKMRDKFEELWTQWLTELVPEGAVDKTKERIEQMKRDIQNILDERFPRQQYLIKDGLDKHPLDTHVYTGSLQNSITEADIKPEHFKIVTTWTKVKNIFFSVNKEVVKVINNILSSIDVKFDDMSKTDADYDNTHFSQILQDVLKGIDIQNETTENDVRLKPSLGIFVVLHVSRYSYNRYKEIIRCYEKEHSIMTRLLKYKPQAQRLFIDVCEAKSQEMQATHALCNYLKDLIKERVERNIYRKIQTEINERYFSQKSSLMKKIMEEMADKSDFERYMRYIKRPACYVFEWIIEMTNDAVFSKLTAGELSLYVKWTNNDTKTHVDYINDAVDATAKVFNEQQELDIEKWKSVFVEQISKQNLLLTSTTFEHVKGYKIKSFKEFRENIKKELSEMETQLITEFNQTSPKSIKWPNPTPYQCIFDTLWGCKEICPFCSEPCQRAQANHASKNDNHTCIQHRCTAVNGTHWKSSGKLTIESCNFKVQSTSKQSCKKWCKCPNLDTCENSHPYKDYKTYFPDWDIESSTDTSRSVYWNWFVATYRSELAKYYETELPDIPKTWYNITKEKAIESLNDVFPTL